MPRPMLRTPQTQTQNETTLSTSQQSRQSQNKQMNQVDQMKLDRLLREPRSKKYMDAMHQLDAGGHVHNQYKVNSIINAIKEEFPEVEISKIMLGIVSICYLGKPYEVHTLDMTNNIIEHYEAGKALPSGMEKARGIAMRGGYEFIEVYVDCCRCVSANGSVAVVKG